MSNDFVSDQTIFDAGFTSRRQFNEHCRLEGLKAECEAARQMNTTPGQERNGSRFYEGGTPVTKLKAWQEQQRGNAPVEQKSIPVPIAVPTPKPTVDHEAARQAYHDYFKADSGYEKGKQFVAFGIAIGEIPSDACGLTGGQAQANRISKILHDREITAFRYDREGVIQHVQQVPQ